MTNALAKAFERKTGATRARALRRGRGTGQPDRAGGLGLAGRRAAHREHAAAGTARREGAARARSNRPTLAQVPARYDSPSGHWVGVAARETVLIYNPKLISAGQLPPSILDLAKPEWKGKLAIAPSEPDFVPIVSAIDKLDGRAATEALAGRLRRQRQALRRQRGDRRGGRSRPGRARASSTTTTGTSRAPRSAPRRCTASSTTSATRTPARSSTSPAPAR